MKVVGRQCSGQSWFLVKNIGRVPREGMHCTLKLCETDYPGTINPAEESFTTRLGARADMGVAERGPFISNMDSSRAKAN